MPGSARCCAGSHGPDRRSAAARSIRRRAADGVLEQPVHQVHVVAVELHTARDLVAGEAPAMDDELQPEALHCGARATGAARCCEDVAKPAVEEAKSLAEPVGDLDIAPLSRAAERVPFDLLDRQLPA